MIEWIRKLFTAEGHKECDAECEIAEAHARLRAAAHEHVVADIEAENVSLQTIDHAHSLIKTAKSAISIIKEGEGNHK